MENKVYQNLTGLINQLTFENKWFTEYFKASMLFKTMSQLIIDCDFKISPYSLETDFQDEYETFITHGLLPSINEFGDLTPTEDNEIDKFLLDFYRKNKDVLLRILTEKIPFIGLINFTFTETDKNSLTDKSNIHNEAKENSFNEIMKEKNKVDEFYGFLNFYNTHNLKNPVFRENKVFSNKQLVRKTYHHGEKEIQFYFDKLSHNLEFFIVENYNLTDLDYNIQDNVDILSIVTEFKKSL